MNHNEFVQALKAGKVSGAYLFEGVEENIKSCLLYTSPSPRDA